MDCTCVPCTTPSYGAPGFAHCAACCYGTLIEEYNPNCQFEEHRDMARKQYGLDSTSVVRSEQ